MDTTTVDYAIRKVGAAITAAAPHVQEVSEKYVRFIMWREVLDPIIIFLMAAFFAYAGKWLYNKRKDEDRGDGFAVCGIVVWALTGLIAFWWFFEFYEAIIAYSNPEMFTIQKLIDGATK